MKEKIILSLLLIFLSYSNIPSLKASSCQDQSLTTSISDSNGVEMSLTIFQKDSNFSIIIKQPSNPLIFWTYPSKSNTELMELYPILSGFDDLSSIIDFLFNIIENEEYQIQINSQALTLTLNLKVFKKKLDFIMPINEISDPKAVLFEMSQLFMKVVGTSAFYGQSEILLKKEFDFVQKWINPNGKIKLTLLYKGFSSNEFHIKCDNKGSTLVLVESHLKKRFGGFTSVSWGGNRYITDDKAFLFSLNEKKKFNAKKGMNHIYSTSSYGPTFGSGNGHDIYLSHDCATNFQSTSNLGNSYELDRTSMDTRNKILAGNPNFLVTALEVFLVEFETNK